jgi:hypothetical protein
MRILFAGAVIIIGYSFLLTIPKLPAIFFHPDLLRFLFPTYFVFSIGYVIRWIYREGMKRATVRNRKP